MRLRKYLENDIPWYIIDDFILDDYISTISFRTLYGAYNTVKDKNDIGMTILKISLKHADKIILEIYFDNIEDLLELIPEEFL